MNTTFDNSFINGLKILNSIDRQDWMTDNEWTSFARDPFRYLMRCPAAQADLIGLLLLARQPTVDNTAWLPIAEAPDDTWLEVAGPKGLVSQPYFICIARRMPMLRPLHPWCGLDLHQLSDAGLVPKYYRPLQPMPDMKG